MPREKPDTSSSPRSDSPAAASAPRPPIAAASMPYSCAKNVRFWRAVSSGYRCSSCASRPIWRTQRRTQGARGRSPYRTSPLVGATRVAGMPIRVDLPAPFGPSRPTISPRRADSETCETARRRPKCRETSTSDTWSKSAITRRGRGGRRAPAPNRRCRAHRRCVRARPAATRAGTSYRASAILPRRRSFSQPHQIGEQLLAPRDETFALGRARVRIVGSPRQPGADHRQSCRPAPAPSIAARRCDAAGCRPSARSAALPATGPPVPAINVSPDDVMSCCREICGDDSLVSPSFLTTTASCSSVGGKPLGEFASERAAARQLECGLNQRTARRKRTGDLNARARHASPWATTLRESSCRPRRLGRSNANVGRRIHRRLRVVRRYRGGSRRTRSRRPAR